VKYHLQNLKSMLSKGAMHSLITLFLFSFCVALVLVWKYYSNSWSFIISVVTAVVIVVAMTLFLHWLLKFLKKAVDVLIFRKHHNYRQTLLDFSRKIGMTIDLEQLAMSMLSLLTKRFHAKQTSLLMGEEGYYTSKFVECYINTQAANSIVLRSNSPIVSWLERESHPIIIDSIINKPEFQNLAEEEKAGLKAAEVEVLCPLKSKQKLVAILALSKRHQGGRYSRDDIDLMTILSSKAADNFENASLYESAKQRANTDELTGLFNHGFFHQRLEEEIARSSRYGEVFSLILMDIDNFKMCNDVSGHLTGDKILKNISSLVRKTARNSDICFRYGGDEFAIILPQTTIDGSRTLAERIRKGVESLVTWPDNPLSVSLGVASWPTDGVLKDDLIRSSDAALYHSKHTGKNRINVACEVALSEVFRIESSTSQNGSDAKALLKTIYSLAASVDAKDSNTEGHSQKVSRYATKIAGAMGFTSDGIERIRTAALLHDIGKIGIPEQIFKKTGLLTADEREVIQAHPNLGVSIIQHVEGLRDCLAGIQYHHEHYNGKGYPSGLKGSNIPLDARILAVADSFDAMTSPRPYRKSTSHEEALNEIKRCAGTQFDPHIADVFVKICSKGDILAILQ
jgi:diguanylate cyclase (GGDEF)-like protein/putative nucleotidyltransferase with HDIG domain